MRERGKSKMFAIYVHELKLNFKNLVIWSLSVGIMGLVCMMMYTSMEGEMAEMAESFPGSVHSRMHSE